RTSGLKHLFQPVVYDGVGQGKIADLAMHVGAFGDLKETSRYAAEYASAEGLELLYGFIALTCANHGKRRTADLSELIGSSESFERVDPCGKARHAKAAAGGLERQLLRVRKFGVGNVVDVLQLQGRHLGDAGLPADETQHVAA